MLNWAPKAHLCVSIAPATAGKLWSGRSIFGVRSVVSKVSSTYAKKPRYPGGGFSPMKASSLHES
jgi:hypothetical protein